MLRLPPIEFVKPRSMQDVLAALTDDPADDEVRLVAAGTDLWPNMKRRHQQAKTVISLMSIPQLRGIETAGGELRVGATTTLTDILRDEIIRARFPAFARAVASISSPPLRNMATLGGNLCIDTRCTYYNQSEEWRRSIDYCLKERGEICWVATKSPRCWAHSASDAAPILCTLGARVKLVSSAGERVIPLAGLYREDGIEYLNKRRDEVLTEILIPADSDSEHCRSTFWKLRRRGSIDFSVLSVAAAVWTDSKGMVTRAAMYLGAVESRPMPVDAMDMLLGKSLGKTLNATLNATLDPTLDPTVGKPSGTAPGEQLIAAIARQAHQIARPLDNTDFTPSWRGKMVEHYAQAALGELAGLPMRRLAPRHGLTVV